MLKNKIDIIPAIDIINGHCVRLVKGDYQQQTTYHTQPLDIAKTYQDNGIQRLHLVDLDGAKAGAIKNLFVLETIAKHTTLTIDFGGGIQTKQDVQNIFNAGATMVSVGSLAIKNKPLWQELISMYGPEKILLGADVKNEKIAISGWLEQTQISLSDFLEENSQLGIQKIFITDIHKDGLLQGPAIELYSKIHLQFPHLQIIASGGIHVIEDIQYLLDVGCSGVIIGKAIYENKISLQQLKTFL